MMWPMMVYSAVMMAMCVTILRRMFVFRKSEYVEESKKVFEGADEGVLRWLGVFSVSFVLFYFWMIALIVSNIWLMLYAVYKTVDTIATFRKAIRPQAGKYPSLLRRLATWADFLVIVYFVTESIIRP